MKEFVVYNCKDILIGFGSFSLTGYADDAFLTIEDMAEEAAPTSGCDSAVVTSLDPNPCSKVTITNLYGVKANKILNNLAQRLRDGELQTFPLLIKKRNGEVLLSAEEAWVAKTPNSDFGRKAGNRQWILYTADSERGSVSCSAITADESKEKKRN